MWKIGPECVAQQKKLVRQRIRNCGERIAWRTVMPEPPSAGAGESESPARAGGRRIGSEAGIITAAATAAMIRSEVRQS